MVMGFYFQILLFDNGLGYMYIKSQVEQKAIKLEESSQFMGKSNEGQGTSRFLVTINYRAV